jgi:hypothetical protein
LIKSLCGELRGLHPSHDAAQLDRSQQYTITSHNGCVTPGGYPRAIGSVGHAGKHLTGNVAEIELQRTALSNAENRLFLEDCCTSFALSVGAFILLSFLTCTSVYDGMTTILPSWLTRRSSAFFGIWKPGPYSALRDLGHRDRLPPEDSGQG